MNSFQPERFILGMKQLTLVDPMKKIRKMFKVYEPSLSKSTLFDCKTVHHEWEVARCFSRLLRARTRNPLSNGYGSAISASLTICHPYQNKSITTSQRRRSLMTLSNS